MNQGFVRVVACAPEVSVADVSANEASILKLMRQSAEGGAQIAVFPELCITAYTCGDLFHQQTLLDAAEQSLGRLAQASRNFPGTLFVVGAPVKYSGKLYNCAVFIACGAVIAYVPKIYLPNYNEFYEQRWFTSGEGVCGTVDAVPISPRISVNAGGVRVGAELCEDLWAPVPPSTLAAVSGCDIIVNLSASDDLIGKYSYLRSMVARQSAACICTYVYASAGYGESSTDLVFNSKLIIAENGRVVASNPRWEHKEQLIVADVDIDAIRRDRMHFNSYRLPASMTAEYKCIESGIVNNGPEGICARIDPMPFVPADNSHLAERCDEIIHIQAEGLAKRLEVTHTRNVVIGISGGLDSTLALLVTVSAFDTLGIPRAGIHGITMPGFGTTGRTHSNAVALMEQLGITSHEIPIADAVRQHFHDIGHDGVTPDVTYENSQARERTQILMDYANKVGGMVIGTGDLSELALGWATYNGDHMSNYAVNSSVPKTLVRHLTRHFATKDEFKNVAAILLDILDTPISPELTPADSQGNIAQKTEDLIGPYELHDFFLYHVLRHGFGPRKIFFLAENAFGDRFDKAVILKWLRTFFRRFFSQQFKRSCLPDGPKVGSVCLSPRGDWRMPSDASAALWLDECDKL